MGSMSSIESARGPELRPRRRPLDTDADPVHAEVAAGLERARLRRLVRALPARHRVALVMRYGLVDDRPRRLAEIAQALGVSESRALRIVQRAMARVQAGLDNDQPRGRRAA